MYLVKSNSPMIVTGSDGIPATVTTTKDLSFKHKDVCHRPLRHLQNTDVYIFRYATLTVVVSGEYVIENFTDEPYFGCYAVPSFVGPRPHRHYFRPFIRKSG